MFIIVRRAIGASRRLEGFLDGWLRPRSLSLVIFVVQPVFHMTRQRSTRDGWCLGVISASPFGCAPCEDHRGTTSVGRRPRPANIVEISISVVGDEQQRKNLARRYVETTDKLRQLGRDFRLLETAKG
jgi:hypothetical protein